MSYLRYSARLLSHGGPRVHLPAVPQPAAMGGGPVAHGSPYTYGVFSEGAPYAFPPYYHDPHLESSSAYSGFGGFGSYDVPGVGTVTCDPGMFIDKVIKRIPGTGVLVVAKNVLAAQLKKLTADVIKKMMAAVESGKSAFNTWYMSNVAYNLEQASSGLVPQSASGTVVDVIFGPIQSALNECRASVSQMQFASGPRPIGVDCDTNADCQSGYCGEMPYGQGRACMSAPTAAMTLVEMHFKQPAYSIDAQPGVAPGVFVGSAADTRAMIQARGGLQLSAEAQAAEARRLASQTKTPSAVPILAAAAVAALMLLK